MCFPHPVAVAHVTRCAAALCSARWLGDHAGEDVDRPAPVRYHSGLAVVRRLPTRLSALGNWYFFKCYFDCLLS